MSSRSAAPPGSRRGRKSATAQRGGGVRRVSLRLRAASGFAEQPASSGESDERLSKRTTSPSPTSSTAKRMRLLEVEEKAEEGEEEVRVGGGDEGSSPSSMGGEPGSRGLEHDETIEDGRQDGERSGASSTVATKKRTSDMQLTSSYSSSSDDDENSRHSTGELPLQPVHMEMDEEYLEEEDIYDEQEVEDEDDDDDDIGVDKTDIITSDEDDFCSENKIDGPVDTYERMQRFRKLSVELGQRFEMVPLREPAQLSNRCHGVGPAAEVWSLLCHKDELHSICDAGFLAGHDARAPITGLARATLVDWLQEVCTAERLHRDTFHLAIDYLDRFMAKGPAVGVHTKLHSYQLVGTTALFLAAKYEEIYPPKVEDVVLYTAESCNADQVRDLELIMLKVLEWELNVVTPLHWVHLFIELLTGAAAPFPSACTSASTVRLSQLAHSLAAGSSSSCDAHFMESGEDAAAAAAAAATGSESEEAGEYAFPATTGSGRRDDYVQLAYIMDTVLLHDQCRRFSNRVLAAAVLFVTFNATEAVEQVTGLSPSDGPVREAMEWVEPIVAYCEHMLPPLIAMPAFDGIKTDEAHTIQIQRVGAASKKHGRVETVLADIARLRAERIRERAAGPLPRDSGGKQTPPSQLQPLQQLQQGLQPPLCRPGAIRLPAAPSREM